MRRFMPQSRRPNGRLCCSPVKLGRSTLNAFAAMQVSAPAQTLPGLDPYRHALHDRRFSMSYDVMTTCKHPIPFCVRSVTHRFMLETGRLIHPQGKAHSLTFLSFTGFSGKMAGKSALTSDNAEPSVLNRVLHRVVAPVVCCCR